MMQKQEVQVGFIPDNISKISSLREGLTSENSQKIDFDSVSRLSKDLISINRQNPPLKQSADGKLQDLKIKFTLQQQDGVNPQFDSIKQKIQTTIMNTKLTRNNNTTKTPFSSFPFRQNIQNSSDIHQFAVIPNQRKLYFENNQATNLYPKKTETDVISQKESFIQAEDDFCQENFQETNKIKNKGVSSNYHQESFTYKQTSKDRQDRTCTTFQNEQMKIIQYENIEAKHTVLGWLQHNLEANYKNLYSQTLDMISYVKANLIEKQRKQIKTKIIQLQFQVNRLKILLRKSPQTKHINFSIDFMLFNRSPYVKVPKIKDQKLRSQAQQLEEKLIQMQKEQENQKQELQKLQFYEKQFQTKVKYIDQYLSYLQNKARKEILPAFMTNLDKKYRLVEKQRIKRNQVQISPEATKAAIQKIIEGNMVKKFQKSPSLSRSEKSINHSLGSLAGRLGQVSLRNSRNQKIEDEKITNENVLNQQYFYLEERQACKGSKKNKRLDLKKGKQLYQIIPFRQLSEPKQHKVKILSKTNNKRQMEFKNSEKQQSKQKIAKFYSKHRRIKHFYYECQQLLKQLESEYNDEIYQNKKEHNIQRDIPTFRQRQILRMKQRSRRDILDKSIRDFRQKQNKLRKQISKLKLLLNQDENKSVSLKAIQQENPSIRREKNRIRNYQVETQKITSRLHKMKSATTLGSRTTLEGITPVKITPIKKNAHEDKANKLTFFSPPSQQRFYFCSPPSKNSNKKPLKKLLQRFSSQQNFTKNQEQDQITTQIAKNEENKSIQHKLQEGINILQVSQH